MLRDGRRRQGPGEPAEGPEFMASRPDESVAELNRILAEIGGRRTGADGRAHLTEPESYMVLKALGINVPPYVVVKSADDLRGALERIPGDRVVMKVVSPDLPHKSDVGGVRLNVPRDVGSVTDAYGQMMSEVASKSSDAKIEGVMIAQQMELGSADTRPFRELLFGVNLDDAFGPMLFFGQGGKYTESYRDVAGRTVPLSDRDVREVIRRMRISEPLINGSRGEPPIIEERRLAGVLKDVSDVVGRQMHSDSKFFIEGLEANPLAVTEGGELVALDAAVTLVARNKSTYAMGEVDTRNVDAILSPKRIAVVGASNDPDKLSGILFRTLCEGDVEVIPINRKAAREGIDIQGRKPYASISELPEPVDLVFVAIPAPACPDVVSEIVRTKKARAIVLISGGFSEVYEGRYLEEMIRQHVEGSGIRINGPNCMGLYSSLGGEYNGFFLGSSRMLIPHRERNRVAFISQSGGLTASELSHLETAIGCAVAVSTGNQMDLGPVEYLSYLRNQPDIKVMSFYIESFKSGDGRLFAQEAAKARGDGKVVIVYKSGKTEEGAKMAASHTSRMAGGWDTAVSALRQAGVWVTEGLEEFDNAVRISSLLADSVATGRRTAIASISGADCILAADHKGRLEYPQIGDAERGRLETYVPDIVTVKNPLDLSGGITSEGMLGVVETMLSSDNYDNVVLGLVTQLPSVHIRRDHGALGRSLVEEIVRLRSQRPGASLTEILSDDTLRPMLSEIETMRPEDIEDPQSIVNGLIALHRKYPEKPMVVSITGSWRTHGETIEHLERAGIPCFQRMEQAIKAVDGFLDSRLDY